MLIAASSPAADASVCGTAYTALTGAVALDIDDETDFAALAQRVDDLDALHERVLVTGRPGLLTRYRDDDPWTLVDLAGSVRAPVVIVTTVSEADWTALALARLADDAVPCPGVVLSCWPDVTDRTHWYAATRLAGLVPLLGVLPARSVTGRARRAALAPLLGGTFDAARFLTLGS